MEVKNKEDNRKTVTKAIGKKFDDVVLRTLKKFKDKYKFEPHYYVVTDMIAEDINKKGIKLY